MMSNGEHQGMQEARIMLGLLEQVERNGGQTQRRMASELGVALGLVNAYLKRCVKKGLMKVSEAPARRYAYYLTLQGFAEKARLSVDYFSYSLSLFRRARSQYGALFNQATGCGFSRLVLAGVSDLAEIAIICALEAGVEVVAVVDDTPGKSRFVGISVFRSFDELAIPFDAVVITAFPNAGDVWQDARVRFGEERIFVPPLLGLSQPVAEAS
ncbi:winged helix-turn-helix transcriptional regulator [Bradyrhizobium sp. CB1650]|uniref:winged helix-turn-helix transcriptional regulator n=1 Tax=Bradyrhizobium sp. CB1650 TaxID=3039153 RepID=UPI0024348245|nr:winged helix-turn-helix transcriptional regulator [Bradyrhizobium sp. CB1650]WGD55352.1 winged helix-turn-helix transcriptional regulator [Bradyrhizobium sp. CB1650]